jgi:hypothetical protein
MKTKKRYEKRQEKKLRNQSSFGFQEGEKKTKHPHETEIRLTLKSSSS